MNEVMFFVLIIALVILRFVLISDEDEYPEETTDSEVNPLDIFKGKTIYERKDGTGPLTGFTRYSNGELTKHSINGEYLGRLTFRGDSIHETDDIGRIIKIHEIR